MVGGEGCPSHGHRPEDLQLTEAQGRGPLQAGDPAQPPSRASVSRAGAGIPESEARPHWQIWEQR